jgi:cytochrome b subunit of formate dehydrogenase
MFSAKRSTMLAVAFVFCCLCIQQWLSGSALGQSEPTDRKLSNADCLACHSFTQPANEAPGQTAKTHIDDKKFGDSVHRSFNCTNCHTDVKGVPHDPVPARVNCGDCHTDANAAYNRGLHARAIQTGNAKAAGCGDCHGDAHAIRPSNDPVSKVNHANISSTCGACHGQKFVMEASGLSARPFLSYEESVHGRAVAAGNARAAVCTECHGVHDILPATDPDSTIFKFNVPHTCGKCHSSVAADFGQSIHGQSVTRGNSQSPVCTDCHGIHMIKPHIDPTSSVASQALARTTCAKCHEGVKLSEEFGVADKRASSYLDSYHGLASKLGSSVVANCASCHGVHNILPSTDPKSTTSQTNLVQTCGKCHPGAGENFILGKIHLDVPDAQDTGSLATRWVRNLYILLIGLTIGSMLIHNGLIWRRKALDKRRARVRTVVRMTRNQRLQHLALLSSFGILVITGFALKYPDSWLAATLGSSETVRRIGHRAAAVVLILASLWHVGYVLLSVEGRRTFKELIPAKKDLLDLIGNLRYYLGRSSDRPKIGLFGYAEKAEYWAVIWGVIIMGGTGLMVWFKVGVFGFLPRWWIDVALAVHFYEAILATLAIIVWHFYQVIFDPDVYPINWAWLDGQVPEKHFREEHPLAYERMIAAESPEAPQSAGEGSNQGGSADLQRADALAPRPDSS